MLPQYNNRQPNGARRPRQSLPVSLVTGIMLISFATTASVIATLHIVFREESLSVSLDMADGLMVPSLTREGRIEALKTKYKPSIWTTRKLFDDAFSAEIKSLLSAEEKESAMKLCSQFLFSSIRSGAVSMSSAQTTFVSTGDFPDMWIRDSTVQVGIYYGRQSGLLRNVIDGTIRQQALFILQDPYANAYYKEWKLANHLPKKDRVIGRGGWVGTRNYELDSGAYYLNQLYDYYVAYPSSSSMLLQESAVFQAVELMVDTWIVEQHHEERSPYRYFELPRKGVGPQTEYTGMTWSGFRPSDEPNTYGYSIASNIHAAAGLERILAINEQLWKSSILERKATKLLKDIEKGIHEHGIVNTDRGVRVYAYEVDGMGNSLVDYDDANIPSLLSLPLLGWTGLDEAIYEDTKKGILSDRNPFYFEGTVHKGIGSSHTPKNMVWPMTFVADALTTKSPPEVADRVKRSLESSCRGGMPESVNVNGCRYGQTRAWFEWSNALLVVLVETAFGDSCEHLAQEKARLEHANTKNPISYFHSNPYQNDQDDPLMYQGIEASVRYEQEDKGLKNSNYNINNSAGVGGSLEQSVEAKFDQMGRSQIHSARIPRNSEAQ